MTMPHLSNCPHDGDGWCIDCIKELWEEKEKIKKDFITSINRIDSAYLYDSGNLNKIIQDAGILCRSYDG